MRQALQLTFDCPQLCYTRSSVIPLILTVACTDPQALDVLSNADAFPVRLRRILTSGSSQSGTQALSDTRKMSVSGTKSSKAILAPAYAPEYLGTANWWRSPYGDDRPNESTRTQQGEIHLPSNLAPAGHLPRYKLSVSLPPIPSTSASSSQVHMAQYEVVLDMPTAVAFVPTKRDAEPLQAVTVEIATVHGPGPRPLAYTPPKYTTNAEDDTRSSRNISREQPRLSASQAFM